jgi:hypothetical protein
VTPPFWPSTKPDLPPRPEKFPLTWVSTLLPRRRWPTTTGTPALPDLPSRHLLLSFQRLQLKLSFQRCSTTR